MEPKKGNSRENYFLKRKRMVLYIKNWNSDSTCNQCVQHRPMSVRISHTLVSSTTDEVVDFIHHFTYWFAWLFSMGKTFSRFVLGDQNKWPGYQLSSHASPKSFRRQRRRELGALIMRLGWHYPLGEIKAWPYIGALSSTKMSAIFTSGQLALHTRFINKEAPHSWRALYIHY